MGLTSPLGGLNCNTGGSEHLSGSCVLHFLLVSAINLFYRLCGKLSEIIGCIGCLPIIEMLKISYRKISVPDILKMYRVMYFPSRPRTLRVATGLGRCKACALVIPTARSHSAGNSSCFALDNFTSAASEC
jgi:hypothetical protein